MPVSVLRACLASSGARTVKLEDPPTPPKIGRLLDADPSLSVFGGLGGASALWELDRGACGTMTGFAYPEILRAVRVAHERGERAAAGRLFDRYLPLIAYEAQPIVGLAIRKELLRRRGAIDAARDTQRRRSARWTDARCPGRHPRPARDHALAGPLRARAQPEPGELNSATEGIPWTWD